MKRLILISAIIIFSCSSDDSNEPNYNNDETFLERYNGVIWQIIDDSGDMGQTYVRFNNDTLNRPIQDFLEKENKKTVEVADYLLKFSPFSENGN